MLCLVKLILIHLISIMNQILHIACNNHSRHLIPRKGYRFPLDDMERKVIGHREVLACWYVSLLLKPYRFEIKWQHLNFKLWSNRLNLSMYFLKEIIIVVITFEKEFNREETNMKTVFFHFEQYGQPYYCLIYWNN